MPGAEKLRFNCGVCSAVLTDSNALFTSCGHFFCRNKRCTGLMLGSSAGKCEQCGQECDAGTLENRAERYDDRVKSFVFASLPDELRKAAEILEFRGKHMNILSDNANCLVQRNGKLKEEISRLMQENNSLRTEIERLKQERLRAPKDDVVINLDEDDCAQSEVTPVGEAEASVALAYAQLTQERHFSPKILTQPERMHSEAEPVRKWHPRGSSQILRERKQVEQKSSRHGYIEQASAQQRHLKQPLPRQRYYAGASQGRKERKNVDKEAPKPRRHAAQVQAPKERQRESKDASMYCPHPARPRVGQEGKQVQSGRLLKSSRTPMVYRNADTSRKRGRSSLYETEKSAPRSHALGKSSTLLRKRPPRVNGSYSSTYAGSSATQVPAQSSYAGGTPSCLSRLGRTSGPRLPNRPYASSLGKTTRSFGNSWQARVSSVPRPSVTPDQLECMRKRARPNNNPLAPRR